MPHLQSQQYCFPTSSCHCISFPLNFLPSIFLFLNSSKIHQTHLSLSPLIIYTFMSHAASATVFQDSTIKIWDTTTGRLSKTLSGHIQSVTCVKWGGEGLIYSASQDRTIKVWKADDVSCARHFFYTMAKFQAASCFRYILKNHIKITLWDLKFRFVAKMMMNYLK